MYYIYYIIIIILYRLKQNVARYHKFGVVRGRERFDKELRCTAVGPGAVKEFQHQRHCRRKRERGVRLLACGQRGHSSAAQCFRAGHKQVAHKFGRAVDGNNDAG